MGVIVGDLRHSVTRSKTERFSRKLADLGGVQGSKFIFHIFCVFLKIWVMLEFLLFTELKKLALGPRYGLSNVRRQSRRGEMYGKSHS